MGLTETKETFPESRLYSILDYGYCRVWQRKDNRTQTMEQYQVLIQSPIVLQQYRQMWLLRTQQDNLVSAFYFTHQPPSQICGVYQKGSMLIQRIPYRLSQFSQIPYQQILYIMRCALESFKVLHNQYGLFLVRSTMIGINGQRKIKVWHHTDLASPQPENPNCKNLSDMIDSIIVSIEMNADYPIAYARFSQFLKANRNRIVPTFDQIIRVLNVFMKLNKIPIKEGLPRLADYLRQAQGWEQLSYNNNFMNNLSKINQLHQSQMGRRSSRDSRSRQVSVSSSKKTLKNNTNFNVYTHKQVNQMLSYDRKDRKERSQHSKSPIQVHSPHNQKIVNLVKINHNQVISPVMPKSQPIQNKIQFKINNLNKKTQFRPVIHKSPPSTNSIDRRLQQSPSPTPQFISIYTSPQKNQPRINKFNICFENNRFPSRSPASSSKSSLPLN